MPAGAQEDFRSSDPDRPIRVEDAYPLKLYEWEWQLGTRTEITQGGSYGAEALLELKTGFARNWQAGIELHGALERTAGASTTGLEEVAGHLLFNMNQETAGVPALALRADLFTPGIGDLRRQDVGGRIRGIATTSFGRLRFHTNVAYAWAGAADGDDVWSGGLAFDYPIGLFSKAVLGDVYIEAPTTGGTARVWTELGARLQLTNTYVLDLGIATRVDEWSDGRANGGIVLGLSRTFGVPGLVKVSPYPEPAIR